MVNLVQSPLQADDHEMETMSDVTCPGCGLLCDDLIVGRNGTKLEVRNTDCPKSLNFFQQAEAIENTPRINGEVADLAPAVQKAASILRNSHLPLISGLATDVYGMRSILELAEMTGATLDHMNSNASIRNVLTIQNTGWHTCTLTEVRNRVDLLLVIGGDIVSRYPRFFERVIWNQESMFGQDTAARDVIYLGYAGTQTAGISPRNIHPTVLPCDNHRLPEVINALLALANGKSLKLESVAGIPLAELQHLADRLASARYSVIAWSAADFDFPHAELTLQQIAELIAHLNHTTRCSGLPLSGSDGDTTASQVSSWISGFPLRTSYKRGFPEYDPYRFATDELLDMAEADALVWISTLNPERMPPLTVAPTIVIGHPGMKFTVEPDVFIPVGIPGVDHSAIMFRGDSSVALPLKTLRESSLPSLRQVLDGVRSQLGSDLC